MIDNRIRTKAARRGRVKLVLVFTIAGALHSETRALAQPCSKIYPVAVQTMTAAHFEPTVSDAQGGILNLKYTGDPMVYNFMVKHATPYLDKYVVGGSKRKYRGLTYTKAAYVMVPADEQTCKVTLTVSLAALDTAPKVATRHTDAHWERTAKEMQSNGTAEREFLDAIASGIGH